MRLEHSLYHKTLRVLVAVFAFVLLFESGLLIDSTAELSGETGRFVATVVGMGASVEQTELNTITAELTEQRLLLDQREAALAEREIAVELRSNQSSDLSTYILSALVFILLVLIVVNYALDYLRTAPRTTAVRVPVQ